MAENKQSNPMAHLVEDLVEVAVAGQALGLKVLQAEMEALSQVLPGVEHHKTDAERAAEDLKVEADFDNMPV